jgi:GDP-4-dehydro-6-deoxy-D-mannose reductase
MRALITGSAGFVGRHLAAHLHTKGDEVTGFDRESGVDILDHAAVERFVADARPDAVYHLAGQSDVGASWDTPVETFRANAEGTLALLEACRHHDVHRVLVISSADVYGHVADSDLPLPETAPLRPVSPYAASKVAADFLGLQAWLGHGLPVVRVRAFNHLGPGQSERFVAPAIAARIARNEVDGTDAIPVGNLEPRRDLTDVRDVVRAYRLLVERAQPGAAYNVCSGDDVPVGELAERLVAMAAGRMRLVVDPALQRPVDNPVLRGDNRRIRAETGWEPTISLDQTLADVLADARARVRAEAPTS